MARARSTNNTPERDSLLGAALLSALLHAAALFGAFVVWPYMAPPEIMASDVVPVDLLTVADLTNVAPQEEQIEQDNALPEPLPVPVDMPPPPPDLAFEPPPPPVEETAPEAEQPPPEEKKVEPPKPEPQAARYAMSEPRSKPKPEKKKKDEFNLDDIMKGLDSTPKETKEKTPTKTAAQRTLRAAGAQSALTASEIDALRGKLAKCWNVPVGAPDPSQLKFWMKFKLNEDGTVASPPELDPAAKGQLSDSFFRAAVDSAKRAIHICGPYELPPEKYAGENGWNEINIEFDPTKMAGY